METRISLRADDNVVGGLAFRLLGSRNHGVYVVSPRHGSKQGCQLEEGDRLLACNDVSLRGMATQQVAAILRGVLSREGQIELLIRRESEVRALLRERSSLQASCEALERDREETSSPEDCFRSCVTMRIPTSNSFTIGNRCAQTVMRSRPLSVRDEDRMQLLPARKRSEQQRSHYFFDGCSVESCAEGGEDRFRCPICLKYTSMRRMHLLRHEWAWSARRLLPRSATELFGSPSTEYAML